MSVEVNLLERVVGVAEALPVEGIKTSEPLMVSVGTATTVGVVTSARENRADMALKIPVVAELGQRVAVSRRIGGKLRLFPSPADQGENPPPAGASGSPVSAAPRLSQTAG